MRPPVRSVCAALCSLSLAAFAGLPLGCDKDGKSSVERRAEEIAASASAQKAAASVSASAPDPQEQKYAAALGLLRDKNVAYMTSLQKLYTRDGKDEEPTFRAFFPQTKEGEKTARELIKEAEFTGREGMAIAKFDVGELSLDDKMTHASADVTETQMQRGKPRCIRYKLQWQSQGGASFARTDKTELQIIPCP
ncbi:MAG: hypothetical protein NVS3B10_12420 [Polyangiales bacterium]